MQEQAERLARDAMLRVVRVQADGLEAQLLGTARISREQLAHLLRLGLLEMRAQRLPFGTSFEGGRHGCDLFTSSSRREPDSVTVSVTLIGDRSGELELGHDRQVVG